MPLDWSCRIMSGLDNIAATLFDSVFLTTSIILTIVGFYRYRRCVFISPEKERQLKSLPSTIPWEAILLFCLVPLRFVVETGIRLRRAAINNGGWVESFQTAWGNASLDWFTIILVVIVILSETVESKNYRDDALRLFSESRRDEEYLFAVNERQNDVSEKKTDFFDDDDESLPLRTDGITKTVTISVSSSDDVEVNSPPRSIPTPTAAKVVLNYYWGAFTKALLAHSYLGLLNVAFRSTVKDGSLITDDAALWFAEGSYVPMGLILATILSLRGFAYICTGLRIARMRRAELVR